MRLRNVNRMLVIAMWICACTISMVAPTGVTTNRPNAESGSDRSCPKYCECTDTYMHNIFTARCTELIDNEYTGPSIKNFVLEKSGLIKLGIYDLRVRGLEHVAAIEIKQPYQNFNTSKSETFPYSTVAKPIYTGTLNIHPDIFKNKTELKTLVIQQFENLEDSSDIGGGYLFNAPSVDTLFFSVLNYRPWSPLTFSEMPKLSKIHLVSPKFKMAPGMFVTPYGLRNLTIEQAYSWTDIGPNDFDDIPVIQQLEIHDNIKTIHQDAFSHLSQLENLDISYNQIKSFTDKHLRNNTKLQVLRMSYNEDLKLLPVFKLESSANDNYGIHTFACSHCGLTSITDGTFNAMPSLEELDLGGNSLKKLPQGFFKPLISLRSLDLSRNSISNIPTNMFEGAKELSNLILRGNPITTLELTQFSTIPELTSLDLSECQIKTWNAASPPVNSLKTLSITGNELENITTKHLQTIPNISMLEILYNPIKCDELKDIKAWSLERNVTTQFSEPKGTHCKPKISETCWAGLEKIICSQDYPSMLDKLKQERYGHPDDAPGEEKAPGSAPAINHFVITLIMIVTTIAVTINNDSQILFI